MTAELGMPAYFRFLTLLGSDPPSVLLLANLGVEPDLSKILQD